MKLRIVATLITFVFCFSNVALAQDAPATEDTKQEATLPYEIVITPTISRRDLRGFIVQVEEDFFAKFNELNLDDDYDVFCYEYIPVMSHIPDRVCEPAFMIRTRADMSSKATFALGSGGAGKGAISLPPRAMRNEVGRDYEVLQEKMEELNTSNAELRSIGSVLAQLKARLNDFGEE